MLGELALLKRRALRKGVWFRALSRVERSIYDLTMKTVSTIRSKRLLRVIRAIVDKLRESLKSPVSVLTRTVGRQLVLTLAQVALSWGHLKAREWCLDEQFARYLAICWHMNVPKYYRASLIKTP
mgnify:FL=1